MNRLGKKERKRNREKITKIKNEKEKILRKKREIVI